MNITSNDGRTALMAAAWRARRPKVLTLLINAGADVTMSNSYGTSAFTTAALRNFGEGFEILIEAADKTDPTRYLPPLSDIEFISDGLQISNFYCELE